MKKKEMLKYTTGHYVSRYLAIRHYASYELPNDTDWQGHKVSRAMNDAAKRVAHDLQYNKISLGVPKTLPNQLLTVDEQGRYVIYTAAAALEVEVA